MKYNFLLVSVLSLVAFLFAGCPVGIEYPAGYPGKEKIDHKLIGNWFNSEEDPEVKQVRITKSDDYSLHVEVLQTGSLYSIEAKELTGWCTEIGDMKFVYWQPVSETDHDYFLYGYRFDGNILYTYDVSLLDGGVDSVKSVESYRKQIETSLKMPGCLTDTIRWEAK